MSAPVHHTIRSLRYAVEALKAVLHASGAVQHVDWGPGALEVGDLLIVFPLIPVILHLSGDFQVLLLLLVQCRQPSLLSIGLKASKGSALENRVMSYIDLR